MGKNGSIRISRADNQVLVLRNGELIFDSGIIHDDKVLDLKDEFAITNPNTVITVIGINYGGNGTQVGRIVVDGKEYPWNEPSDAQGITMVRTYSV